MSSNLDITTAAEQSDDQWEEMDDGWLEEVMSQSFTNVTEKPCSLSKKTFGDNAILCKGVNNRYRIVTVNEVTSPSGFPEKHLTITASQLGDSTEQCVLQDDWESTDIKPGDIVHVEGENFSGPWVINRDCGYLIWNPDHLISGTSVANSIRCMRRAVLSERGTRQMLFGTLVHEIFQKAATSHGFTEDALQKITSKTLRALKYLGEMYSLKLSQAEVLQEISEYVPSIIKWAEDFMHNSPWPSKHSITVTDIEDIEENIWSPRFGIKGKIDVTASVKIHRQSKSQTRIMPLELKTGKESNSIEHRSQVILYTLLSQERREDPEAGFLLYLKTGTVYPVPGNRMDRRELLKLRNQLAFYLANGVVQSSTPKAGLLPPVVSDRLACKFCSQLRNCALYSRAIEEEQAASFVPAELKPVLDQETEHLTRGHLQYFSLWYLLCIMEANTMDSKGGRRLIWMLSAEEREQQGGCIGYLLRNGAAQAISDGQYQHQFIRKNGFIPDTALMAGDRVVVSGQEKQLLALSSGYIIGVTESQITCVLDRNLSKLPAETIFRFDHDEGVVGVNYHLANLSKLMEASAVSTKLRELIVDHRPPQFIPHLSTVLPQEVKETVANILKGLNKPQKQAMKRVLLSRDYTLIVGMPGTGKTTTICTLVPAPETDEPYGLGNVTEAQLVYHLTAVLLKAGCRGCNIGIIAPYRQQLKTISALLAKEAAFSAVEVNTVDKYQGRDKSVIIASFVRSNRDGNLGELLKDWRRLNVAVTRAKHKLIMVGCVPTLRRYAPLEKLLDNLSAEQMISFTFTNRKTEIWTLSKKTQSRILISSRHCRSNHSVDTFLTLIYQSIIDINTLLAYCCIINSHINTL
uniref:DNA replication ATP-dependent helicase/nuclease DNA2 n=1 Tax=Callorhinchus milii TaxID=7868 RepID=A0A4W3HX96_CALMI